MVSSSYFQAREVLDHGCVMYVLFCKLWEVMMYSLGKEMHLWFAIKKIHVLEGTLMYLCVFLRDFTIILCDLKELWNSLIIQTLQSNVGS
jgi:hypothetical protein